MLQTSGGFVLVGIVHLPCYAFDALSSIYLVDTPVDTPIERTHGHISGHTRGHTQKYVSTPRGRAVDTPVDTP